MRRALSLPILAALLTASPARAETATAAIASNFAKAAREITASFEAETDHRVTIVLGSTGKLYAHIQAGAPFDVFLSADQQRPRDLIDQGLAVASSQQTYALGQLTLWSADPGFPGVDLREALSSPATRTIAIANPALAPYGAAARQVLDRLGIWPALKPRIVMGENIGQALALIGTGNASLGFIATAQLPHDNAQALKGRSWPVAPNLYDPVRQDAVLLTRAKNNPAAKAFLAFLDHPKARAIVARLGYRSATD